MLIPSYRGRKKCFAVLAREKRRYTDRLLTMNMATLRPSGADRTGHYQLERVMLELDAMAGRRNDGLSKRRKMYSLMKIMWTLHINLFYRAVLSECRFTDTGEVW